MLEYFSKNCDVIRVFKPESHFFVNLLSNPQLKKVLLKK